MPDIWEKHPEVEEMILLQQQGMGTGDGMELLSSSESSDEEQDTALSKLTSHSNKFTALMDIKEDSD